VVLLLGSTSRQLDATGVAKDVLNEAILQRLSTEFAAAKCLQCDALVLSYYAGNRRGAAVSKHCGGRAHLTSLRVRRRPPDRNLRGLVAANSPRLAELILEVG